MKIVSIVGARPQFIKAAPVSYQLRKSYQEILVHTGQHYDPELSAIFFEELGIPRPDYNLEVGSGNHGEQTGRMLIKIEEVLVKEAPDIVLVYGDTNSTLAGALAAAKLFIPFGHIEAGLRSFNRMMPEEINRIVTDHLSNLLFAPTQLAIKNLHQEGIKQGIHLVGDVMYEAALHYLKVAQSRSEIIQNLNLKEKEYLIITLHRPSNTDNQQNLSSIVDALYLLEEKIIFPIHPRTKKALKNYGLYDKLSRRKNVVLLKPISYLDMLLLESKARLVLTDSGGVQKEAYFFKVPCVTLREETEWKETVEDGWNRLVGTDRDKIVKAVRSFRPPKEQSQVFGDGQASKKIKEVLGSDLDYGIHKLEQKKKRWKVDFV